MDLPKERVGIFSIKLGSEWLAVSPQTDIIHRWPQLGYSVLYFLDPEEGMQPIPIAEEVAEVLISDNYIETEDGPQHVKLLFIDRLEQGNFMTHQEREDYLQIQEHLAQTAIDQLFEGFED